MKKTILYVMAASMMFAAISCEKEEENAVPVVPEVPEVEQVPYSLSVSSLQNQMPAIARSYVSGNDIIWEAGDALAVIDDINSTVHKFTIKEGDEGDTSATFEGSLNAGAATIWVVYPYDGEASVSAGAISATMPSAQQVGAGGTKSGALLAVGTAAVNEKVELKNAFGLVKVTVKHDDVNQIVLRGTDIAGAASYTASTGVKTAVTAGSGVITLTPAAGEDYFTSGESYYIAAIPGTTAAGSFSIEMQRELDAVSGLDASATYTFANALEIERNKGLSFDTDNARFSWSYHIASKDQLFAWNASHSKWTAADKVYLENDIDMESDSWTPHTFRGTFDGQDHKLYNFIPNSDTEHVGFFSDLYGAVKNLIIGSSDGSSWDGVSIAKHEYSDAQTAWNNAGSVCARLATNGTISNVTNFAKVEQGENDNGKRCRLGGIAGYVSGTGTTITGCVNYGSVTNNCTSTVAKQPMGGIVASAEKPTAITDCTNRGAVTSNCAGAYYIGGIMGITAGINASDEVVTTGSSISSCDNYGQVSSTIAGSTFYVGGIVGLLTGGTISECTNYATGTVFSTVTDQRSAIGGIAGGLAKENNSAIVDCTNKAEVYSSSTSSYNDVGGILGYGASSATGTVEMTRVTNEGEVHTCGSSAQSAAGGIIGRLESAGVVVTSATNSGAAVYVNGTATQMVNVAGICAVNNSSTANVFDGCQNSGTVHNEASYNNISKVGGILGYAKNFEINCDTRQTINSGNIYNNGTQSNNNSRDTAEGGIVAFIASGTTSIIEGTSSSKVTNEGKVYDSGALRRYAGGIVGFMSSPGTVTVKYAYNTGEISSTGANHFGDGGIVGGIYAAAATAVTIQDCVNEGEVKNVYTASASILRWAGGILGRHIGANGTLEIMDCVNGVSGDATKGKVTLSVNSNKTQGVVAGGIVGGTTNNSTISGNINYAPVALSNARANYDGWAGGILGGEDNVDNTPSGTVTVSGNYNYGTVSVSVAGTAPRAGAGGIIGWAKSASIGKFTGNYSYGNVAAAGTMTAGGAGAVIGDSQGAATGITATVSKGITVGGVTYAAADAAGTLASWLCPNNNNIAATYAD